MKNVNKSKPLSNDIINGLFLNADSLTNKLPELNLLVSEYDPHIIGINEVLPKNYKRQVYKEEFALNGYEMITHSNVDANTGRGSIIYIKNNITYKQINIDINGSQFEESLFIEVPLKNNDKLLCGCLYRRGQPFETNIVDNLGKLFKTTIFDYRKHTC